MTDSTESALGFDVGKGRFLRGGSANFHKMLIRFYRKAIYSSTQEENDRSCRVQGSFRLSTKSVKLEDRGNDDVL